MVGTLSGTIAIGSGVSPTTNGEGTLSASGMQVYTQAGSHSGGGSLSARIDRALPVAWTGGGTLTASVKQIYTKQPALSGGGALTSPIFFGTGFKDMVASGDGVLVASTGGERYFSYPELSGEGTLSVAYKEIQTSPASFEGTGTLDAQLLPTTQVIWRTDQNVAATSQPVPSSATDGVYVTLLGKGGNGGNGAASNNNRGGAGGGGSGGYIPRFFIPRSVLGTIYSTTVTANATFSSNGPGGDIALIANAGVAGSTATGSGGGLAGVGGSASATGVTTPTYGGKIGGDGGGTSSSGSGGVAGSGGGPGSGGGGGGNNGTRPGGSGGSSSTASGGAGTSDNPGYHHGGNSSNGTGGGGGSGGRGSSGSGAEPGGNGGTYGAGGGGGGSINATSGAGPGGTGGPALVKLEWAAKNNIIPLNGNGTLSATMVPAFEPFNEENVPRINQPTPAGCVGAWVSLIGAGGAGGNGGTAAVSGSGGGGGGRVDRTFIPVASLGPTYTVTRGVGGASATASGSASTFSSGSVSLSAGGGGGGKNSGANPQAGGAGGVCSATGVTATTYPGGAGGAAVGSGSYSTPGEASRNNAGPGGGSGSSNSSYAGGVGGNSSNDIGGMYAIGSTPAVAGKDGAAGDAGSGGGGGSTTSGGQHGAAGGLNGGGGGGGGKISGALFAKGGDGYTLVEFVKTTDLATCPITIVGYAVSATTSIAIPAHQIGDLIVLAAVSSSTSPVKPAAGGTVPAWAEDLRRVAGQFDSIQHVVAHFVATATNHTSGTWTNAQKMGVVVLRGQKSGADPIGARGIAIGTLVPADTTYVGGTSLRDRDGSSLVLQFLARRGGTAWGAVPTGYTRLASNVGSGGNTTGICINCQNSPCTYAPCVMQPDSSVFNGSYGCTTVEILAP